MFLISQGSHGGRKGQRLASGSLHVCTQGLAHAWYRHSHIKRYGITKLLSVGVKERNLIIRSLHPRHARVCYHACVCRPSSVKLLLILKPSEGSYLRACAAVRVSVRKIPGWPTSSNEVWPGRNSPWCWMKVARRLNSAPRLQRSMRRRPCSDTTRK